MGQFHFNERKKKQGRRRQNARRPQLELSPDGPGHRPGSLRFPVSERPSDEGYAVPSSCVAHSVGYQLEIELARMCAWSTNID
jgi:hypothetical protein